MRKCSFQVSPSFSLPPHLFLHKDSGIKPGSGRAGNSGSWGGRTLSMFIPQLFITHSETLSADCILGTAAWLWAQGSFWV